MHKLSNSVTAFTTFLSNVSKTMENKAKIRVRLLKKSHKYSVNCKIFTKHQIDLALHVNIPSLLECDALHLFVGGLFKRKILLGSNVS